jgi:DNA-binding transcriptional regulator YhcF (GntR family)
MQVAWQFNAEASVSKQIAKRLRADIVHGRFDQGGQFPTVRQLAVEMAVNPNTVQKALSILEAEGLLEARSTLGRFITCDQEKIESTKRAIEAEYVERVIKEASAIGITTERLCTLLKERNEIL